MKMEMSKRILLGMMLCLMSFFLVAPSGVLAAAGDYDGTFNAPFGFRGYNYPFGTDTVLNSIVRQTDGMIVAAGYTTVDGSNSMLLVRFNVDGTLDSSFGSGGAVLYSFAQATEGYAVAMQQDGKILVAGSVSVSAGARDIALWRFNSNGTPDSDFGPNGIVTYSGSAGGYDLGRRLVLQSDGKILVAGYKYNGSNDDAVILRYNSSGNLDAGFGSGGVVTYNGAANTDHLFADIIIQPDGKLVLCGAIVRKASGNRNLIVLRYNNNGTIDTNFGTGGVFTYAGSGNNAYATSIAIQSDNKLVVGGAADSALLLRLNSNGTLDNGFNMGGAAFSINGISIQTNGKIVVVGATNGASSYDFSVWRLSSNGDLDTGFGSGGYVTFSADTASYERSNAVLIQPDGKIVAAGKARNGSVDAGFLMRLLPEYYTIDTTPVISGTCSGSAIGCTPNPVQEGGNSQCMIEPDSTCYTKTMTVKLGMVNFPVDPVWLYGFPNVNANKSITAEFAPATIWLIAWGGFPVRFEYVGKTDETLSLALYDAAANNYHAIRMPSGAYVNPFGFTCSDAGTVVPVLSGGWTDWETRGTVPTLIAHILTISDACALIIDEITIQ